MNQTRKSHKRAQTQENRRKNIGATNVTRLGSSEEAGYEKNEQE